MKVSLVNQTPLFVVLYSVDYESKQERLEVGEVYGSIVPAHASVPERFNVAGMPGTELRIKDFTTQATLHRCVVRPLPEHDIQTDVWREPGNPRHQIVLNISNIMMATYTHVQFISWEVYTGPNRGPPPWAMNRDGISYTGIGKENAVDNRLDIEGQIEDIEERLQFTYKAIEEAHKLAAKRPTTLKVFMAPEFLYRGKGGAYIHDLINGWEQAERSPDEFNLPRRFDEFPGLFGYLKRFATGEKKFNDWLFVFGTAISASFPARFETNKGWVVDSTQMGEIYNTALVQRGGSLNMDDAYASRKRYIASIDFIKSQYRAKNFTLGDVVPADRLRLEPNESNREGSATFTINGINDKAGQPIVFGLEVCLDHSISTPRNPQPPLWANSTFYAIGNVVFSSPGDGLLYTCGIAHTSSASPTTFTQDNNNNPGRWVLYPYTNPWGRLRTADKWVKIQLVPSGGMHLKPASIRLLPAAGPTPHSYAFHCDGLTTLAGDPNYRWGAHTQIWNGANGTDPVPPANKLVSASYEQEVSNTSMAKVADQIYWQGRSANIYSSGLWDLGSGYVRVMPELPL